jgi:hypothetical protein
MAKASKQKFQQKINRLRGIQKEIMPQAYQYFKSITPVDTGNAKRNTFLRNYIIYAKYAYAKVLDLGRHSTPKGMRGSNQAPRGMSLPTMEKFKGWVKLFIRKL